MELVKKISILILIVLISGCSTSHPSEIAEETSDSVPIYIIQKPDFSPRIDSLTADTILAFINYYYDYNIILIDSLPQIYYHRKRWVCGGCVGERKGSKFPDYIGLNKERLKRADSLSVLLDQIFIEEDFPKYVYLISNKDSISDSRYFVLKDSLKERGVHIATRLLTEEETNVLLCVLNDSIYHSDNYSWQNTNMDNILIIDIDPKRMNSE